VSLCNRKPKNQRVKRVLEAREPKIHENDKTTIFIKGGRTSDVVTQALKELHLLKKPLSVMYHKKNITRPFEDQTSVEFFSKKSDASLFLFGSHSKKRPNNLVLGRLFDYNVLDMIELGIDKFKSMSDFPGRKCAMGTKPCVVFAGEAFEQDEEHKRLRNLMLDFLRGPSVKKIRLPGLEHVYHVTAVDGKILLRSYRILLRKSGSKTPRIELEEMGPSLDLVMRRTHLASHDLYKRSCKRPLAAKPKKKKNVSQDAFGTQHGQVHMQKQDLDKLQLRKMKGLKKNMEPDNKETTESGEKRKSLSQEDVPKKKSKKVKQS